MKNKIYTLITIVCLCILTSCKKEEAKSFEYNQDEILGTWKISEVFTDLKVSASDTVQLDAPQFIVVGSTIYKDIENFYLTLNTGKEFSSHGYMKDQTGSYKTYSNIIELRPDRLLENEEFGMFMIHSLSNNTAEVTMSLDGKSDLLIRVRK